MSGDKRPLWTLGRQLVGNILPLVVGLPFLVFGLIQFAQQGAELPAALSLAAFPLVTWLATNFLALVGNQSLKREMASRVPAIGGLRWFVGFSPPGQSGWLDPHSDLGYFVIHPDRIEFVGSATRVTLKKSEVVSARFRPNVHTWLGLGRWVSVEGQSQGRAVRLLVEPREKATLLGNRAESARLLQAIRDWHRSS
ncbi:MAG: hypothetical protein KF884_12155 [Fimbriimonadaceae bacterium]|nr:MAG: hypothetical protein KF884_12155 [Fimbriimonadaceae bacterium]